MATRNEGSRERQAAIRELLATERVRRQGELAARLRARGFAVTQSSVSRDLAELRATKLDGRYVLAEALRAGAAPQDELAEAAAAVLRLRPAGPHLLVLLTRPGRAAAVGVALDGAGWPEVVGTLAGDDTVFMATASRQGQARLSARIAHLVRGGSRAEPSPRPRTPAGRAKLRPAPQPRQEPLDA